MASSPYSVLAAFVAVLEAGLGFLVLAAAVRAAVRRRWPQPALAERDSDAGIPILGWAGMVLLGTSIASWPLLYLLLQSEVTLWPGVMCIQGVVQVGRGSPGATGALPSLLAALQLTKPALVFVAGAWLVLHLADRRTRTAPLAGRLLFALGCLGCLAVVDAGLEAAYLVIPKTDAGLATGCCTFHPGVAEPQASASLVATAGIAGVTPGLTGTFFGLLALVIAGAALWAWRGRGTMPAPAWAAGLLVAAAASIPVGAAFLAKVEAPALLHRPEHRCAYCVLGEAPESLAGIGLFLVGAFAVGWAVLAAWGARHAETEPHLSGQVRGLLLAGVFGYAGAALFAAVALGIA